jgi:hypothetical protein
MMRELKMILKTRLLRYRGAYRFHALGVHHPLRGSSASKSPATNSQGSRWKAAFGEVFSKTFIYKLPLDSISHRMRDGRLESDG